MSTRNGVDDEGPLGKPRLRGKISPVLRIWPYDVPLIGLIKEDSEWGKDSDAEDQLTTTHDFLVQT